MTFDAKQVWEKLKNESTPSRQRSKKVTQSSTTKASTQQDNTSPLTEHINSAELTRLLQAKDSNTRRQALHKLKDDSNIRELETTVLICIGRELVILFAEGTEKDRSLAGVLLKDIITTRGCDMKPLLKYLMPLLGESTATAPNSNQATTPKLSEELRLMNMEILLTIVDSFQKDVEPYITIVHSIIVCGCHDAYSKVTEVCCCLIQSLCDIFGIGLHQISKEFVANVAPLLLHRHSRVRIAAIETLSKLIQCGAHEMILELVAFRNPNIIPIRDFYEVCPRRNFLGMLMMDNSTAVRLAALELIRNWLLNLPESVSYLSRLLPYLLTTLVDPFPLIREKGCEALEDLGTQFQKDNEEEVEKRTLYLPEQAQGSGWTSLADLWTPTEVETDKLLQPFTQRPSLSARLLVQSNFSYFISALCRELTSDDDAIVQKSLNLLRVLLLLLEEATIDHINEIRDALVLLISNRSNLNQLTNELKQVCFLLGRLVDPETLFPSQERDKTDFLMTSKRHLACILLKEYVLAN